MMHERAATGLWVTTSWDDRWFGGRFWDTRDEAVRDGIAMGQRFVGRVVMLTDEDVAKAFLRSPHEASEELLSSDEWGWCQHALIEFPDKSKLAAGVAALTEWVKAYGLCVYAWRVEAVEKINREAR